MAIDIIYLLLASGGLGTMLGGILLSEPGIIVTGIPECFIVLLGIKFWPVYTKQRWDYLKNILVAFSIALPFGIAAGLTKGITWRDKLLLAGIFAIVDIAMISTVISARAKFPGQIKEVDAQ